MEILGYTLAVLIGITLGLLGSGGSILTIPILVYILGTTPVLATAYSLFIVGVSSFIGFIHHWNKGLVNLQAGIIFVLPSILSVYLTRLLIIPSIPEVLYTFNKFILSKDLAIMVLFGVIMLITAFSMLNKKGVDHIEEETELNSTKFNYPLIGIEGLLIGTLTGIVGAGGGFLIVPALVIMAKLPMKLAVGTSLFIIATKSLVGFIGDIQVGQVIDWPLLLSFSGLSILGIFIGVYLSNFINGKNLKKVFGWFVLITAIFILIKELSIQL